ncbi:flavin reductase family protein [Streptomyces sp. AN091965]|uniref:flavin reductase family protein n=1 Tax=Streptomyces sp. AN091965 TaxID=2927803 RepID=UPI001F605F9B|nr:flavin reductase family protein [Streptomyces sp. AN091965]MCI3935081.1 flavin reductase family protein [Streptomyces sp. AN091965]
MTTPATAARDRSGAVTDEQRLRGVTRRLPTGVAVLTARDGDAAHGATVSTVSVLTQRPLRIGASLRRGSYLATLIRRCDAFAVNVLSSGQSAVADWFANPERPRGLRQFAYVPWAAHPTGGMPILGDALAHFTCRPADLLPLGASDDLLVADVVEGQGRTGRPLLNFGGDLYDIELRDVLRVRRDGPSTVTSLE